MRTKPSLFSSVDWRRKNPFDRPSQAEPFCKGVGAYPYTAGPLRDSEGFSAKGDSVTDSPVVLLLGTRCPSAVIRRIPFIVVDAIERVFRAWTFPNICEEVLEGIRPSIAYHNTAIVIVGLVFCAIWRATTAHSMPRFIFWRFGHAIRRFGVMLSATLGCSLAEVTTKRDGFITAITTTKPHGIVTVVLARITDNGQAAELMAGQVLSYGRGKGYNLLSHVRTSFTNVMRGLLGVRCTQQSPLFYHNTVISSMACQI
jgi:hypothetical protein